MSMFRYSFLRVTAALLVGFAFFVAGFMAIELMLLPERLVSMFGGVGDPSTGMYAELATNAVLFGLITPFFAVMTNHLLTAKYGRSSSSAVDD